MKIKNIRNHHLVLYVFSWKTPFGDPINLLFFQQFSIVFGGTKIKLKPFKTTTITSCFVSFKNSWPCTMCQGLVLGMVIPPLGSLYSGYIKLWVVMTLPKLNGKNHGSSDPSTHRTVRPTPHPGCNRHTWRFRLWFALWKMGENLVFATGILHVAGVVPTYRYITTKWEKFYKTPWASTTSKSWPKSHPPCPSQQRDPHYAGQQHRRPESPAHR